MRKYRKKLLRLIDLLRANPWFAGVFITLLAAAFTFFFIGNVTLAILAENHLSDLRVAVLSPPKPQSTRIAVVLIDDKTLAQYPYRSPLDRSLITGLLDELETRSPTAIGINVLFERSTETGKDQQLFERLRSIEVPVVLSRVSASLGFSAEQVRYSNQFLKNLPTGLSVSYRDPFDHTIRSALLRQVQGRTVNLGFAATLANVLGIELPPDEKIMIDYRASPDITTPPFPIYAAHEVAHLPPEAVVNRIILIGTNLDDSSQRKTPLSVLDNAFSQGMPGVVIEAHILSQLIEQRALDVASTRNEIVYVMVMAALGCLVSMLRIRLVLKILLSLVLLPLAWIGVFFVFFFQQILVPMVAPTFAFAAALLFSIFWQWRTELQLREKIHQTFGQFLAPAVVEKILRNPDELELGGEMREVTLLFSDLEGFTGLTESTPPHIMVQLVNTYLEEACAVVIDFGGTIDKIVGDALHVMFNAPLKQGDHAQRAVLCALALDHWSESFRQRLKLHRDIELGVTRIGVNTGSCIVGNFGGNKRFDYTAHGDPINTAARLEAINQRLGTRICVSETTVAQCERIHFRSIASLVLRGRTQEMRVYMPVPDELVNETLSERYERAYSAFSTDAVEGGKLFAQLEIDYPDDPLIHLHAQRLESGESDVTLIIRKK